MDQLVEITELADKLKEAATTGVDDQSAVRGANQVNYGQDRRGHVDHHRGRDQKRFTLVTNPNKN